MVCVFVYVCGERGWHQQFPKESQTRLTRYCLACIHLFECVSLFSTGAPYLSPSHSTVTSRFLTKAPMLAEGGYSLPLRTPPPVSSGHTLLLSLPIFVPEPRQRRGPRGYNFSKVFLRHRLEHHHVHVSACSKLGKRSGTFFFALRLASLANKHCRRQSECLSEDPPPECRQVMIIHWVSALQSISDPGPIKSCNIH